jgi:hypothetical protein
MLAVILVAAAAFAAYVIYYNQTKSRNNTVYREAIQKELRETGKLTILEGSTRYKIIREETKDIPGIGIEYGNKTATLDLQFNYGYAVDLSFVKVDVGREVTLSVDIGAIKLDYVYLDINHSYVESKSSLLVKNYTPQEINAIQGECVNDVRDELLKNTDNASKARESLEKQLKSMIGRVSDKLIVIRYEQNKE